ncbi:MAG: hypothetical protein M1298_01780, partial [Chloroflexi bacterium]|nr:hypothetical protein [Chloroflexota bacterium]
MTQPSTTPTHATVIDIGSATVHLLAASWEPSSKTLTSLLEWSERPMLGAHVEETGSIPLAVIDRVAHQLRMLAHRAQTVAAPLYLLLATEAVRQAQNRDLACRIWRAAAGLDVTIITPTEEAVLALLGAQRGMPAGNLLFADSGGGSTQVVFQCNGRMTLISTLPIGASSLTRSTLLHDPPTSEERAYATARVRQALASLPPP